MDDERRHVGMRGDAEGISRRRVKERERRETRSSLGSPLAAHNYSGPKAVGETPLTWWLAGEWDHGAALSRPVSFSTTSVSQSRGLVSRVGGPHPAEPAEPRRTKR